MRIKLPREQLLANTFKYTGFDDNDDEIGCGSGLMVRHHVPGKGPAYFLVTNRHVVEGSHSGLCQLAKVGGDSPSYCFLDGSFDIEINEAKTAWHYHPDREIDVAVHRLKSDPASANDAYRQLDYTVTPTERFVKDSDEIDLCSPLIFVGYPDGRIEPNSLTPIFRTSMLASPLPLDWGGEPCFLVDGSVFPGSSGSPVYYLRDREQFRFSGHEMVFLGLVTATQVYTADGRLVNRPLPVTRADSFQFRDYLNLGVVTKARCVLETIESAMRG